MDFSILNTYKYACIFYVLYTWSTSVGIPQLKGIQCSKLCTQYIYIVRKNKIYDNFLLLFPLMEYCTQTSRNSQSLTLKRAFHIGPTDIATYKKQYLFMFMHS